MNHSKKLILLGVVFIFLGLFIYAIIAWAGVMALACGFGDTKCTEKAPALSLMNLIIKFGGINFFYIGLLFGAFGLIILILGIIDHIKNKKLNLPI